MFRTIAAAVTLGAGLLASSVSHAGVYAVTVSEGLSNGSGFQTLSTSPYSGANTAAASFTYTGPIAFSDTLSQNAGPTGDLNSIFGFSTSNVSNYSGSGSVTQGSTPIANYTSLSSFLASSGSASGYQYGSYYTFDLGVLAAGTVLTITHDDGASIYQNGARLGSTTAGPTVQTTDNVTLGATTDTTLYYSRQNGTPSILTVAVPEPASYALFGAGLLGMTIVGRRRRRA